MPNSKKPDMRFNASGYNDSTAYEALKNVQRQERKKLIYELKELAKSRGYKIIRTIELKAMDGDENEI